MSEKEKKAIERMQEVRDKNVHTFVDELTIVLNLIEKQQNRIYELEKALIDEDFKYRNKIKQYEEQNKEYLNAIKSILLNIPNNEIEISNKDIVQAEKYYVVAKRNVMNNSQKLCLYKGGV